MTRRILILAATLFWMIPAAGLAAVSHQEAARRLDQVAALYERLGIFNGVVALVHGDDVVLEKGYGMASYELAVPHTPSSVFRVASLSKPITALAIGVLIESSAAGGEPFDVDARLERWVPEYSHAAAVTLRQLLEHRSGVPHINSLDWYERQSRHHIDLAEIVSRLKPLPLDFEPGSERRYSNGAYALLALVVERASGMAYGDFLAAKVLGPLGMSSAGHDRHDLLLAGRANGYVPGAIAGTRAPAQYVEPSIKIGGGSLYATVGDFLAFGRALYQDNILPAAMWRELVPPRDGEVWKTGRAPGFYATFRKRLADDWTLVVLANNYAVHPIDEFLPAVLGEEPFELPRLETATKLPAGGWEDFSGTYQWPPRWGTTIEIVVEGPHAIYVELFRDQRVGLFPQGEDGFYLPLYNMPCRFVRPKDEGPATHIACSAEWSDEPIRIERVTEP